MNIWIFPSHHVVNVSGILASSCHAALLNWCEIQWMLLFFYDHMQRLSKILELWFTAKDFDLILYNNQKVFRPQTAGPSEVCAVIFTGVFLSSHLNSGQESSWEMKLCFLSFPPPCTVDLNYKPTDALYRSTTKLFTTTARRCND